MTISYNWLSEYLPVAIEPDRLSRILTSIGLEVESLEEFESIRGSLKGLVVGEVIECVQHPNADKLKITTVNIGEAQPLQIVCGAPNVERGQKVVVAPAGAVIYPLNQPPVTMKPVKIRGEKSEGMICAADEIGIGNNHEGIIVLPASLHPGTAAADYFKPYTDWVFEIGLTPNRMDAMSHLGVARDVCAYLTHHDKKEFQVRSPFTNTFKPHNNKRSVSVSIENNKACKRYSGITISNITVQPSPGWLQKRLLSVGQRPVNNIVDITNFILHETGQPLHAFDAEKISGNRIIVKNLQDGAIFVTLDEKERKLSSQDLMICDGNGAGLCIAGIFGGLHSGVTENTKQLFLESAWFNPIDIRRTSFRHNLRTEAATRFEKNVDISNTLHVVKRAALMIREIAGGEISSDIVDVYPNPEQKPEVGLKYHYLKKLSGKNYHPDTIKKILQALGFEVVKEGIDDIRVLVPASKPDISLPADIVEEIMRIDGYDNIEIPSAITITPSVEREGHKHIYQEKISNYLTGLGFFEIFTNSITNDAYFDPNDLSDSVRLLNNLSIANNIMRPSMLETGLEAVAYNLNRKNNDLKFFEFGRTYRRRGELDFEETEHLCLYVTGRSAEDGWKQTSGKTDIYYLKGIVNNLFALSGILNTVWNESGNDKLGSFIVAESKKLRLAETGIVSKKELTRFDIKQEVFFADVKWDALLNQASGQKINFRELPKQLAVYRDLALVVSKDLKYGKVEEAVRKARIEKLKEVKLFDIFESDKIGEGKKSLAVNFRFLDEQKTLTDQEIDGMMDRIMNVLETELQAEIRRG